MKVRVIVLGIGCVSIAMAEAPAPPAPVLSPRTIPSIDEAAPVPLACDKRLGAYQFAAERYEAKVKTNTHTWEDVANYHLTRADWLQCVAGGQREAIKAERRSRNELITQLNSAHAKDAQIDEAIREARALFEQCDRASLPADQALQACGPQSHVQACATNTVKRLFALENGRSGGPREHVIRSILHQHLLRRVNTLQCVAEHGGSASEPQLEAFRSSPAAPERAAANR